MPPNLRRPSSQASSNVPRWRRQMLFAWMIVTPKAQQIDELHDQPEEPGARAARADR